MELPIITLLMQRKKVKNALSQRIGHTLYGNQKIRLYMEADIVEKFELPNQNSWRYHYFRYSDGSVHVIIDNSNVTMFSGV
jgi:hypothetical protein